MATNTIQDLQRFAFSEARIRDIALPEEGRVRYYDTVTPGLMLRVTTGGKVFGWRGRPKGGTPVDITIGEWPAITVAEAKKRVQIIGAKRATGEDPSADARSLRSESTVSALWEWFSRHHVAHLRESTQRRYNDSWKLHLAPELGSRRLSGVKRSEVQDLVDRIIDTAGPGAARHAIVVLAAAYHAAQKDDALRYKGDVPTDGLRRPKIASRSRFLQPGELPRFFIALRKESQMWQCFWSCCLFVGLRRSNVASARWDDIDLDGGRWTVPGERSKNGDTLCVPIPSVMAAQLRAWKSEVAKLLGKVNERRRLLLKRGDVNSQKRQPILDADELKEMARFVFPSALSADRPSKTPHIVDVNASWRRILLDAKLENLRPHDLRRSIGSWMALGGVSLPIIGAALGHRDAASTSVYARLHMGPVAAAMEDATTRLLAAADKVEE